MIPHLRIAGIASKHETKLLLRTGRGFHSSHSSKNAIKLSHTVYNPPGGGGATGSPFLITHGLLGAKSNWNSIAKAVAKVTNRMVVVFDARNHGDSPHSPEHNYEIMAQDVLSLVKNDLGLDKFSLMGHSMGGRTAMVVALRNSQLLEKLIIVDVSPMSMRSDFHSEMKQYMQTMMDAKFDGKIPLSEARTIADAELATITHEKAVRAFLITNLAADSSGKIVWKPNLPILHNSVDKVGLFPDDLMSQTFDKPTLFIRGSKSSYVPPEDFPGIKKIFSKAVIETIEKSGHWPHADNAKQFLTVVNGFLQS